MTRSSLHLLKGVGYSISAASVILLAIVSWDSASKNPLLIACLLGGVATSIIGMFCRWLSYEIEKRWENHRTDSEAMPTAGAVRDELPSGCCSTYPPAPLKRYPAGKPAGEFDRVVSASQRCSRSVANEQRLVLIALRALRRRWR
ncbi:hypothetical protein ACVDG5_036965 [Mesorhizobium sp. ORM6]